MSWHTVDKALLRAGAAALALSGRAAGASGARVAQLKSRDTLRCGVSAGIAGFSAKDPLVRWLRYGVLLTVCRLTVAALYVLPMFRRRPSVSPPASE